MRIPAAAASPEARLTGEARREEAVPRAAGGSRRVLVVDDNEDAREALRFLLEDDGQEVRTAGDGTGAIAEARSFRPHVVLLDIALPGLDGYAVARALRTMPECDGALIVAVSGYGQAEDRARSREAGFDEHLLKPVAPERLLEIVRRSLETAG
jgi:CheY-like chemotaxis protein